MPPPTITGISVAEGRSIGETFVKITGTNFNPSDSGTISVKFGGVEALEIAVPLSTEIHCLTPGGEPSPTALDITVENLDGANIGSVVEALAFTYKRPSIATDVLANNSEISHVSRQIIVALKRTVLKATFWDAHSEYSDDVNALLEQELQAKIPSIKLLGPTVQRDPEYTLPGRQAIEKAADFFNTFDEPWAFRLEYELVGVGKTKTEATNLHKAVIDFFKKTPNLTLFLNCTDTSAGTVEVEMNLIPEQLGSFSSSLTRDNIASFSMSLEIRGLQIGADLIGESFKSQDEPTIEINPLAP